MQPVAPRVPRPTTLVNLVAILPGVEKPASKKTDGSSLAAPLRFDPLTDVRCEERRSGC